MRWTKYSQTLFCYFKTTGLTSDICKLTNRNKWKRKHVGDRRVVINNFKICSKSLRIKRFTAFETVVFASVVPNCWVTVGWFVHARPCYAYPDLISLQTYSVGRIYWIKRFARVDENTKKKCVRGPYCFIQHMTSLYTAVYTYNTYEQTIICEININQTCSVIAKLNSNETTDCGLNDKVCETSLSAAHEHDTFNRQSSDSRRITMVYSR